MKRMILYIDGSSNDRDSLSYAAKFHEAFGAHLDVTHLRLPEHKVGSVARAIDVAERAASNAYQAYVSVCSALDTASWLETEQSFEDTLSHQGRLHDLTILERISKEEGPEALALNIALFETGGPVLVSPPQPPASVGENVALVWSPSVQSARALRSALPILKRAKQVSILTNSATVEKGQEKDLASYLTSHGIDAKMELFDGAPLTARGRGRAILAAAEQIGADFLVMGAYGENRLRSILGLGRATQKVVSGSPIPLFLQR
ncbi:MAG: universal stress protein [Kiloniellales bacterium]|nr:universal stress protein [Kiloniellales bacterium]